MFCSPGLRFTSICCFGIAQQSDIQPSTTFTLHVVFVFFAHHMTAISGYTASKVGDSTRSSCNANYLYALINADLLILSCTSTSFFPAGDNTGSMSGDST